jgi:hypothetical protein
MTDDLRKADAACPNCGGPIVKTVDELPLLVNGQEYEVVQKFPTRTGTDQTDRDLTPTEKLAEMELTLKYIAGCTAGIKRRNDPTSPDYLCADDIRQRCEELLRLYSRKS